MLAGLTAMALWVPAEAVAWPNDLGEVTVVQPGGLSAATVRAVDTVSQALGRSPVVMESGTIRMTRVDRGVTPVQTFAPGFAVPMAFTAVPVEASLPLIGARLATALDAGVVMSERSAALRGAEVGDTVTLEGWDGSLHSWPISAILPDEDLNWAELVFSKATAVELGIDRPTAVVVPAVGATVLDLLLGTVLADTPLRVRGRAAGASDVGDAVLPTVLVKQTFGEFSFRERSNGRIETDDSWYGSAIETVTLPRLGRFRCNRAVMPSLLGALSELRARGLIDAIDGADFQRAGGCYNPRLARGGGLDRGFAISRHSWGIAIDFNPSTNRFGGDAGLAEDVGQVFRDWGFAWGAGWTVPDPMHFEWTGPPVGQERLACLEHISLALRAAPPIPPVSCLP